MYNKEHKPLRYISDPKRAIQRYARLTGGMAGRYLSDHDDFLLTLDNVYIRNQHVVFTFNVEVYYENVLLSTHKTLITLPELLKQITAQSNNDPLCATANMLRKLKHQLESQ